MVKTKSTGHKGLDHKAIAKALGASVSFTVRRNNDVHADVVAFLKRKRQLEAESRKRPPIEFDGAMA